MKFTGILLFSTYIAYSFSEGIIDAVVDEIVDDLWLNEILGAASADVVSLVDLYCDLEKGNQKQQITPDKESLNFIVKYDDKNVSIPLTQPEKILELEAFNVEWPTIILITGWTTKSDNETTTENSEIIYAAFRCRGNFNFITFDTDKYIDTLYTWSAMNTDEIGKLIADSMNTFFNSYPIEKVQLIGHSLGAHIAGSLARNLDKTIPRLFALDAANPCFNDRLKSVSRDDADYVIAIHTNPGGFGMKEPLGHVDFYPNGNYTTPPGCLLISCSHQRAVIYFAESVYPNNEYSFPSVNCESGNGNDADISDEESYPMGYYTPPNLKGTYCLNTNDHSPYGKNSTENFKKGC